MIVKELDRPLAFDVGGFDGADTARYLDLGYRVICIEASPRMAAKLRERFSAQIASGLCEILNVGAGDQAGNLPFYIANGPALSSFDKAWAEQVGITEVVNIPILPLGEIMAKYPPAEFVKVDVEGSDAACLRSMVAPYPKYLSFEAIKESSQLIPMLMGRGYTRFALIRQTDFSAVDVPVAGTFQNLKWSARQYVRQALRRRKWLHTALGKLRPPPSHGEQRGEFTVGSAGPTPMELKDGWHDPAYFLWLWKNIVDSGIIGSAWFDVHAIRD
jgi:FkbM family methyltransferase